MLWKVRQTNRWPGSVSGRSSDSDCNARLGRHSSHEMVYSRRILALVAARCSLGIAAFLISSAAMAVPIPSASTSSKLNLSIGLSGAQLQLPAFTLPETRANTATAATGLDPLGGLSGHYAKADSAATIKSLTGITRRETLSYPWPIFDIGMQHETLAQSLWTGPMGARASASGSAGFSQITVTAMPGATLTLDWIFDELRLETRPLASLSSMQHMVSITLSPLLPEATTPSLFQAGFSAISRDGKTEWTAFDIPGSTAIRDWLDAMLGSDNSLPTVPFGGPSLTMSLAADSSSTSTSPRDMTITLDVSHVEYSSEAPLAPVRPVAERATSEETGAMTHWDASNRLLSFDQLPLNLLLDAGGTPVEDNESSDLLSTSYLEIDPLVYIGEFDEKGHFVGTGDVRLVARDGKILFETALSGLVYDERLYALESFNLFGPLLGAKPVMAVDSQWLNAFYDRTKGKLFYLPELFIDIGLPAEGASPGNRWSSDFSTAVNASLSFAGPAVVSLPGSANLVLIGLLSLVMTRLIYRASRRTG